MPDPATLLLRLIDAREVAQELLARVDDAQVQFEMVAERLLDERPLAFPQQAVVDEDAGELFADRLGEQRGDDGTGQRPSRQRQRAVDRGDCDHGRQGEAIGEEGEPAEGSGLAAGQCAGEEYHHLRQSPCAGDDEEVGCGFTPDSLGFCFAWTDELEARGSRAGADPAAHDAEVAKLDNVKNPPAQGVGGLLRIVYQIGW